MPLRICSYNIEWFNHLFNSNNSLKTRRQEQERLTAIKSVLSKLDADSAKI